MSKRGRNNRPKKTRKEKGNEGKKDNLKFEEANQGIVEASPVTPLNRKQKYYMDLIRNKSIILATGYAGTSKSYLPTTVACDQLRLGIIDKIYLVRPTVSNSNSIGFLKGDINEKLKFWLMPILSTLEERLGMTYVEYCIKAEKIVVIPLEMMKGNSLKNCMVIIDEAEDINIEEAQKIITRIGKNATFVFAGDILQSELNDRSGLLYLTKLFKHNHDLSQFMGHVDFNEYNDIVRSEECKLIVQAIEEYSHE